MPHEFDAQTALDAARDTRVRFAGRLRTAWWYPVLFGVLVAMMCLAVGLPAGVLSPRIRPLVLLLVLVGALGGSQLHRRTTGIHVQTARGPRTRRMVLGCAAGLVVLVWCSAATCLWHGPSWLAIALATVAGGGAACFCRHYDGALRMELLRGARW